jgi:hypothetical protein
MKTLIAFVLLSAAMLTCALAQSQPDDHLSPACTSLVSKFSMADVQKARNAKGEFLIVTFNGATLLKTYIMKERFIKKLGM